MHVLTLAWRLASRSPIATASAEPFRPALLGKESPDEVRLACLFLEHHFRLFGWAAHAHLRAAPHPTAGAADQVASGFTPSICLAPRVRLCQVLYPEECKDARPECAEWAAAGAPGAPVAPAAGAGERSMCQGQSLQTPASSATIAMR